MHISNKDDVVESRQLRNHKSPSMLSYKSQKALKLLSRDTENSKPFRRRQENIGNAQKLNKNNFYVQDVGKLIVNTSFGSNPDIQKILSTSPRNFQSNDNCQPTNSELKSNSKINHMNLIRENKSMSNFEKIAKTARLPQSRPSVQNVINNSEEIPVQQGNQLLLQKIKKLKREKEELQCKYKQVTLRLQQVQQQLQQKQQIVAEKSNQIQLKKQELNKEKQINKCLEDIILQLNCKIEDLIRQRQDEFKGNFLFNAEEEQSTNLTLSKEEELRMEIEDFKQKIYGLNRTINSCLIENLGLKKLKHELEKEIQKLKCLQKQNKCLKQRISNMLKNSKAKQPRLSLRKELDYSISFDFEG